MGLEPPGKSRGFLIPSRGRFIMTLCKICCSGPPDAGSTHDILHTSVSELRGGGGGGGGGGM